MKETSGELSLEQKKQIIIENIKSEIENTFKISELSEQDKQDKSVEIKQKIQNLIESIPEISFEIDEIVNSILIPSSEEKIPEETEETEITKKEIRDAVCSRMTGEFSNVRLFELSEDELNTIEETIRTKIKSIIADILQRNHWAFIFSNDEIENILADILLSLSEHPPIKETGGVLDNFIKKHIKGEYLEEEIEPETQKAGVKGWAKIFGGLGLSAVSSIFGVKLAHDLPAWFFQKHFIKKEQKRIKKSFEEEKPDDEVTEKKLDVTTEEIKSKKQELIQRIEESKYLTKEKKEQLLGKIDEIIKKNENEKEEINQEEKEKIAKTIDAFIQTRTMGATVSKEFLNSLAFWSGQMIVRGAIYGGMSLVERWQKAGLKTRQETGEKMKFGAHFKDVFVDAARETFYKNIFQTKGLKRIMGIGNAVGVLIRTYGITQLGIAEFTHEGGISESINKLLDQVEKSQEQGKGIMGTMGSVMGKNFMDAFNRFSFNLFRPHPQGENIELDWKLQKQLESQGISEKITKIVAGDDGFLSKEQLDNLKLAKEGLVGLGIINSEQVNNLLETNPNLIKNPTIIQNLEEILHNDLGITDNVDQGKILLNNPEFLTNPKKLVTLNENLTALHVVDKAKFVEGMMTGDNQITSGELANVKLAAEYIQKIKVENSELAKALRIQILADNQISNAEFKHLEDISNLSLENQEILAQYKDELIKAITDNKPIDEIITQATSEAEATEAVEKAQLELQKAEEKVKELEVKATQATGSVEETEIQKAKEEVEKAKEQLKIAKVEEQKAAEIAKEKIAVAETAETTKVVISTEEFKTRLLKLESKTGVTITKDTAGNITSMEIQIGGKGGFTKYLDQALRRVVGGAIPKEWIDPTTHELSAEHLGKVENALANLRNLLTGEYKEEISEINIKIKDLDGVIKFDGHKLIIENSDKLNEIIEKLYGHSEQVVTSDSPAVAFAGETSKNIWEKEILPKDTKITDYDEIAQKAQQLHEIHHGAGKILPAEPTKTGIVPDYIEPAAKPGAPVTEEIPGTSSVEKPGAPVTEEMPEPAQPTHPLEQTIEGKPVSTPIKVDPLISLTPQEHIIEPTVPEITPLEVKFANYLELSQDQINKISEVINIDGTLTPEEAKIIEFVTHHKASFDSALDFITKVKDSNCNINYLNGFFEHYDQVKEVWGNPSRMEGVVDFLNGKKEGLIKIFGPNSDKINLDNISLQKNGVWIIKDVEKGFNYLVEVVKGKIKIGIDGPRGFNYGIKSLVGLFKIHPTIDLTNKSLGDITTNLKKLAESWNK